MVEAEQERNLGAETATEDDYVARDAFVGQYAHDIVCHVAQRKWRCRLGGTPPAADIERNRGEARRQIGDLKKPKIMVEGHGVEQNQRRPRAGLFVIDIETVCAADRHGSAFLLLDET